MRRIAILTTLSAAFLVPAYAQYQTGMTWQGELNGPARLLVQGDRVDVESRSRVNQPTVRVNSPLPAANTSVTATVRDGNGTVRVVEQPSSRNNFTAVVDVTPRSSGRDFYVIDFNWDSRYSSGGSASPGYGDDRYTEREDRRARRAERNMRNSDGMVTWTGRVDRESIITFRGRRADTTNVRGQGAVTDDVQFTNPLPRMDTQVQLQDVRGRGQVEVLEQPSRENSYTAKVRVLDRENGMGDYSFTLAWGDGYNASNNNSGGVFGNTGTYGSNEPYGNDSYNTGTRSRSDSGEMVWSGIVDGRVRVFVQGGRSWVENVSGGGVRNVQVRFTSPLPQIATNNLDLDRISGRDEVRIVQHPSASNGYRLVFEIDDNDSGADNYEVRLRW